MLRTIPLAQFAPLSVLRDGAIARKDLVLCSFLLMGVAACSVVDLFVYVVYVPFFETLEQKETVVYSATSGIDQLRGQLLQLQTEIESLESGV